MVLSDELLDQQGQVLLPKGAVLTARTIALLPGHGIEALAVLRADALDSPGAPVDEAAIERRIAHLFRQHDPSLEHDWATALLRRYLTDFRLGRGSGA
jgi:hypothetical protein